MPLPVGGSEVGTRLIVFFEGHASMPPNDISTRSAVFAPLTRLPSTQTDRQTIYTVPRKREPRTHGSNSVKSEPIFTIIFHW